MKKGLTICCAALTVLLLGGLASAGTYVQAEVRMAPVGRSFSPPPLGRKQGWLTITNRDWQDYSLAVNDGDKLFLYRAGQGYGGIVIPSGASITIALEKETYDLYGNNSDRLKVKVREGRTTTLALEPFGYVGNTGLRGVVNDGDRVRDEVLFNNYAPPIVVQQPPTIIVERPRPPPPPPPRRGPPPHRNDGWGFTFGFGSSR